MKKLLLSLSILSTFSFAFAAPFTSFQLATSTLTNGFVLQTNGQSNRWVSTSSLGISGTTGTTTGTGGYVLQYSPTIVTPTILDALISSVQAFTASAGILVKNNAGATVATFGVGSSGSTNSAFLGNTTNTGTFAVTGTTTLATTTLTVGSSTLGFSSPALFFTNAWGTTASTSAISASLGATLGNLSVLTLASTTALSSTGFSGTNGSFTGTFRVTGVTTLANASTTNLTASTGATLTRLASVGTTTVAVTAGFLGVGTTTTTGTMPLKVNIDCGTLGSSNCLGINGSINSYLQMYITNRSTGASAESGLTVQNASSTDTTGFGWFGINSPNFATSTAYSIGGGNDVVLMGRGNDLFISNNASSRSIFFTTGGTATSTAIRMSINGSGGIQFGTTTRTTLLSGVEFGTTTQFLRGTVTNVSGYTSSSTITFNIDTITNGGIATTTINQTTTFANPVGTPKNGDMFELRGLATTTQTVSWGTAFASSTDLNNITSVASGTTRWIFEYSTDRLKWDLVGLLKTYDR